jgi:hypothetical protein
VQSKYTGSNKKLPIEHTSEYVTNNPEYSIIQRPSSPVGERLKKFYCNMKKSEYSFHRMLEKETQVYILATKTPDLKPTNFTHETV